MYSEHGDGCQLYPYCQNDRANGKMYLENAILYNHCHAFYNRILSLSFQMRFMYVGIWMLECLHHMDIWCNQYKCGSWCINGPTPAHDHTFIRPVTHGVAFQLQRIVSRTYLLLELSITHSVWSIYDIVVGLRWCSEHISNKDTFDVGRWELA